MEERYYIAHVRESDKLVQTNKRHSYGVAILAEQFASEFGMGKFGRLLGLLHDKGKERNSFQSYIRSVSGLEQQNNWYGEDKQHAFIGAKVAQKLYTAVSDFLAYPIMGHHSGLDDYVNFTNKCHLEMPKEIRSEEYNVSIKELVDQLRHLPVTQNSLKFDLHHIIRLLFSCLVDADYLDTEAFMLPEESKKRGSKSDFSTLKTELDNYLSCLEKRANSTPLNVIRHKICEKCLEASHLRNGFYSLTVPTGGGKTLSALVWAINHALTYDKRRVIIAIPYTSIVSQTAQILTKIFGEENVLEHHSAFDINNINNKEARARAKLATENWDFPIIVTTNVQLFESLMSNKPSSCRKLHNITNSVLILDEVQALPLELLQPIIDSLQTYVRIFGVSILFTTASLPALCGDIIWGRGKNNRLSGIEDIKEIIPSDWNLHNELRRVNLVINDNEASHEEIAKELIKHDQVLCIVNTRKDAKDIFENVPKGYNKIHLSRMMCSEHIKSTLNSIRSTLQEGKPIILVATQLIEAGVDIDFPVVYRQEAGLDSLIQAAGRCNREGKKGMANTVVFRFKKRPYGSIGKGVDAWRSLPKESDWFDPQTMIDYFIQRYSRTPTFDKSDISAYLYKPKEWCFETASSKFKLIDDNSYSVIVNYKESAELIEQLKRSGITYSIIRRLSQYTVNIHEQDFLALKKSGLIEDVQDGIFFVSDKNQYDEKVGLKTESHWLEEILTI